MGGADARAGHAWRIVLVPPDHWVRDLAAWHLAQRLRTVLASKGRAHDAQLQRERAERLSRRLKARFGLGIGANHIADVYLTRTLTGWHVDARHEIADWPFLSFTISDALLDEALDGQLPRPPADLSA
jgi:hypothetical protein